MSDQSTDDTDRQEVTLVGPVMFRVDLTDEQIQAVMDSDFPIGEIPEPKEWEPVGTAEDWSVDTETAQDGDADV